MITLPQALEYFRNDNLIALGMAADAVRSQFHAHGLVSYSMETENDLVRTLAFRANAPLEHIVERLDSIERLPKGSVSVVMPSSEGTAVEYLKILALTRIYLTTVPHVQASWQGGLKLSQVALRFGANDINGAEAGKLRATEEDFRRIIRDAGFAPKLRDAQFRTYSLI